MIRTVDVRVDYDDTTAVRDLNLEIDAGEVFGLIGPNGAGKTSTIRVLATLQQPTYGEVVIDGRDVAQHKSEVRSVLGYMPDLAPVHPDLRVWEFLDLFAGAYGLNGRRRRERVEHCLDQVGLSGKRNAMAGTLSRGMAQRLVLAKTLLHEPNVLLLDEPASGLDPMARIDLRNLLKAQAAAGRTVLVSSHILSELSGFCSSVGIMEKGRLVVSGRIGDIVASMAGTRCLHIELLEDGDRAVESIRARDGVRSLVRNDGRLEVAFDGTDADVATLLTALVRDGIAIKAFYERRPDIEQIMLRVGAREVT